MPDEVKATINSAFGTDDPKYFAALGGCSDGEEVRVRYVEPIRSGIEIHVDSQSDIHQQGVIVKKEGDDIKIRNLYVQMDPRSQKHGIGRKKFAEQVDAAAKAGVKEISCLASRGIKANGYYTFARMGHNASLEPMMKSLPELPSNLKESKDLLDLMETKEGVQWWHKNGISTEMTFDPTPGSRSREAFERYLQEKGARGGS